MRLTFLLLIGCLVEACGGNNAMPDTADPCRACATHATCNVASAATCTCDSGYAGDGTAAGTGCNDVNECTAGTSPCDAAHGLCTNTDGGFTCACATGFTGDGSTTGTGCTDVDECASADTNTCDNFTCVNTPGSFQCTGLFAIEPFEGVLARLDPTTFLLLDLVQLTSTGTVNGVTAMAQDPTTGTVYAIAKVSGVAGRAFGMLDLATGVFTVISSVDRFSSLAFLPDGTLYGVTGLGATVPKTLYTIDKTGGTATLYSAVTGGTDGHVICYDRDAHLMYRWAGGVSPTMQSFPVAQPIVTTPIATLTGVGEVFGCRYVGNHTFLIHDINGHVWFVDSAGVVSTPPNSIAALFQGVRAALPTIMTTPHTVRPKSGTTAGGDTVTLHGIGLTGTTVVNFGSAAAASFTVVDDTTITAVTPAGAGGAVDVTATGVYPYPATWPASFTYMP